MATSFVPPPPSDGSDAAAAVHSPDAGAPGSLSDGAATGATSSPLTLELDHSLEALPARRRKRSVSSPTARNQGHADEQAASAEAMGRLSVVAQRRSQKQQNRRELTARLKAVLKEQEPALLVYQLLCEVADVVLAKFQALLGESPAWRSAVGEAGFVSGMVASASAPARCDGATNPLLDMFVQIVCGWSDATVAFGPVLVQRQSAILQHIVHASNDDNDSGSDECDDEDCDEDSDTQDGGSENEDEEEEEDDEDDDEDEDDEEEDDEEEDDEEEDDEVEDEGEGAIKASSDCDAHGANEEVAGDGKKEGVDKANGVCSEGFSSDGPVEVFGMLTLPYLADRLPEGPATAKIAALMRAAESVRGALGAKGSHPLFVLKFISGFQAGLEAIDRVEVGLGGTLKKPTEFQMKYVQRTIVAVLDCLDAAATALVDVFS